MRGLEEVGRWKPKKEWLTGANSKYKYYKNGEKNTIVLNLYDLLQIN